MDSRIAYLNIKSILLDADISTSTIPAKGTVLRPANFDEINRPLAMHVARNNMVDPHGNGIIMREVSHITWEFQGFRTSFFACATFDGTGDNGTTIDRFAMPGKKLNKLQKALILLTLIDATIASGLIKANIAFMVHKISADLDGGVSDLLSQYNSITNESKYACADITQSYCGESVAGSV